MKRRSLLAAAVGLVTAGFASVAYSMQDRLEIQARVRKVALEQQMEDERVMADLRTLLAGLAQSGATGVILPDDAVDAMSARQSRNRLLGEMPLMIYRQSEVQIKTVRSTPNAG